jgi:membrane associated rhomboid family serine protease
LPLPYQWQYRVEKWKNAIRGFFGSGGNNQPRPKICPACGSLVGISATKCHQCGTNLRFSMAAVNRSLSGVFGDEAPITTVLLMANILMFAVSWMASVSTGASSGLGILWGMGGEASYRLGATNPYAIFILNEWYRLVTAMFLHSGLIHLGMNMMALMQFGPAVEEVYGSARYFFLYVVTGTFGYLVSAFFGNHSVGASGAILGLVGVMLALTSKRGGSYMRELRPRLISSVVILVVIGFSHVMAMDNSAHLGGLAAGFALGKLFADREPTNVRERHIADALGWVAGIAVIGSFALMILHYRDRLPGT